MLKPDGNFTPTEPANVNATLSGHKDIVASENTISIFCYLHVMRSVCVLL